MSSQTLSSMLTLGLLSVGALGACRTAHLAPSSTSTTARPPRENAAIRDLRSVAASDLNCAANAIEVTKEGANYGTSGCNKQAVYIRARDGNRRWRRVSPVFLRRPPPEPVFAETKGPSGETTLSLELPHADTDIVIRLVARPSVYPDRALLSFERQLTLSSMEKCQAHVAADETPVALPPSTFRRTGLLEWQLFELRKEDVVALANAQQALLELCGKRVPLVAADFTKMREFVARFDAASPPAETPTDQNGMSSSEGMGPGSKSSASP